MKLHLQSDSGVTLIENIFIDRYMPSANGEFVKLYLYLLRCAGAGVELSISSIADVFDHTEKDVRRALSYWEKLNLLRLRYDTTGLITDIVFSPLSGGVPEKTEHPEEAGTEIPSKSLLSPARKKELREQEEIQQLIFVAQTYLARPLTSTEVNNLLYFYDTLHFSADLTEYLLEYCASKGNPGARYMERVAQEWYRSGIVTVAEAKAHSRVYQKDYYTIFRSFGIRGREPAAGEIEYMDRWLENYGFPLEIILDACARTILQTHQPSFEYADSILKNWMASGVHTAEDIRRLDEAHTNQREKRPDRSAKAAADVSASDTATRFSNFPQRDYDWNVMENALLQTAAK